MRVVSEGPCVGSCLNFPLGRNGVLCQTFQDPVAGRMFYNLTLLKGLYGNSEGFLNEGMGQEALEFPVVEEQEAKREGSLRT